MKSLQDVIGIIQFQKADDAKKAPQWRYYDVQVGQIRFNSWVDGAIDFL